MITIYNGNLIALNNFKSVQPLPNSAIVLANVPFNKSLQPNHK